MSRLSFFSGGVIPKRSAALDSIRATAIIMVVLFHVATRYQFNELDQLAQFFATYGYLGVDIFFPLSGYLISQYLLRATDTASIKTFFSRRFFRIVPLYFCVVSLYVLASYLTGKDTENIHRIWVNYTFLTGWYIFFESRDVIPFTITWSLSVEEFAYILFGLAAWASRHKFPLFLGVCCIFSIGLRFYLSYWEFGEIYFFPPARLDSIALGGITAWAIMYEKKKGRVAIALLSTSFILAAFWSLYWHVNAVNETLTYLLIASATCSTIALFSFFPSKSPNAAVTGYAKIGFYSYFIYLVHFFVIDGTFIFIKSINPDWHVPFWPYSFICLAITTALATISFRVFEGPLIRLGRNLEKTPLKTSVRYF